METTLIGAIDIGGTKTAVAAVTEHGDILARAESPTRPAFEHAMRDIRAMLRAVQPPTGFAGVGIACPGPLDPRTGIIGDVGTLPAWRHGNLIAALQPEFGTGIAVENDADAATLAEGKLGSGQGRDPFLYVTISTGVGAGILLNGRLYRGAAAAHPEIGHQVLDPSGPLCYCKAHGCWESLASGSAIAAWYHAHRPAAASLTSEQVCQLAEAGDPLALQAMEREGRYLGLALANLVTIFAPAAIALGGGVMKSRHLFLPHALEIVRTLCTQVPQQNTTITTAALGADVGLIGAAQAWLAKYRETGNPTT
jgi:glucokinase